MNIYLTIVVVMCAMEASRAVSPAAKLVIKDLNHDKAGDRKIQLDCSITLETGETFTSLIISKKDKNANYIPIFTRNDIDKAPTKGKVDDEITDANIELDPDIKKNVFTITKAAKFEGNYKCAVSTSKGVPDTFVDLKATWDAVTFNIRAKESKDDAKDKFQSGNQLDATLEYSLGDSTLVSAEFKKDDKLYFKYTLDGDKKEPQDGAKDAGIPQDHVINGAHDATAKKISVSIKDVSKDTQGKFKAIFNYKNAAEEHYTSNEVPLTYNGAASAMVSFASISTLLVALVAVRSNL
ncbi:unnamed protein product [Oppiella nova]|uniref:Uncharacterized protein n=1 Tax=Oppiella nova TaxID=334625 RepID=A0A7R9LIT8_9ACAR|nr:unnamed protein product [Oppiella nova]CAG2164060.1 unnamed protein product [Oppiella nova]